MSGRLWDHRRLSLGHKGFPRGLDAINAGRESPPPSRSHGTRTTKAGAYGSGTPVSIAARHLIPTTRDVHVWGTADETDRGGYARK